MNISFMQNMIALCIKYPVKIHYLTVQKSKELRQPPSHWHNGVHLIEFLKRFQFQLKAFEHEQCSSIAHAELASSKFVQKGNQVLCRSFRSQPYSAGLGRLTYSLETFAQNEWRDKQSSFNILKSAAWGIRSRGISLWVNMWRLVSLTVVYEQCLL